jgi:hypothetical protein
MSTPMVIKGDWSNKEAEAMAAARGGSFVFITSNGSKCLGDEQDDIEQLLDVLGKYPLDPRFENYGNFITLDPCVGVRNPDYRKIEGAEEWIDGPRIFDVDGVAKFFGNFFGLSHVFNIYTNDAGTVQKLTAAIRANQQRDDYLVAKAEVATRAKGGRS